MNLSPLDWLIVGLPLAGLLALTQHCKRYTRSVADFLAANRCAGRYVLSVASAEAGYGVISALAAFEAFQKAGLTLTWWGKLTLPVGMLLGIFGFVTYRFRETRALTLAQFFEIRYGRSLRVVAGFVMFVSGIMNFGIFPGVSSQYFVYFCGFPASFPLFGVAVPTYAIIMAIYLSLALWLTLTGGQLTILVTDAVEGILAFTGGLVVICVLLAMFPWTEIIATLSDRPPGQSMLNPFDTGKVEDFSFWYVLIGIVISVYGTRAWQGNQGFNSAAKSPHEARMAGVLGMWRGYGGGAIGVLASLCAFTFLHSPAHAGKAAETHQIIAGIANPQLQVQMSLPVAQAHFLPDGVKGLVCMSMIFLLLANSGSYMHSWGSIFIQDVVLPFRKKPLAPMEHIRWLRIGVAFVAVFGFFFSLFFRQTDYIFMFMAITGALYTAGAGALILGGLYWSRGTIAGGFVAMFLGSALAIGSMLVQQQWTAMQPWLLEAFGPGAWQDFIALHPKKFPLNGQILGLLTTVAASAGYIVVSLLTCKKPFNLDRMLHRGAYAIEGGTPVKPVKERFKIGNLIGFDSNFTRSDKWIAGLVFWYGMSWFAVIFTGTLWNFIHPWPLSWWVTFWHWYIIILPLGITIVTTLWLSIGAGVDLKNLFRDLKIERPVSTDDGRVLDHRNLDEVLPEKKP